MAEPETYVSAADDFPAIRRAMAEIRQEEERISLAEWHSRRLERMKCEACHNWGWVVISSERPVRVRPCPKCVPPVVLEVSARVLP